MDRININSPGLINLKGAGGIVKQIRMFIKDFWFRNKREKEQGKIEDVFNNIERLSEVTRSWIVTLKEADYSEEEIKSTVKYIMQSGFKVIELMQTNHIQFGKYDDKE